MHMYIYIQLPCGPTPPPCLGSSLSVDECSKAPAQQATCGVCKTAKSKDDFAHSQWEHRSARQIVCAECCHPKCTAANCTTCRTCRDPACRKRKCTKTPMTLNSKLRPQSLEEVNAFLCATCRRTTCKCGKPMPQKRLKRLKRENKLEDVYVCADCQQHQQSMADAKHKV